MDNRSERAELVALTCHVVDVGSVGNSVWHSKLTARFTGGVA